MKGEAHRQKSTQEGRKIAQQYFELALEIDPNNALAHVGAASIWAYRYQVGQLPRQEAKLLCKAAIDKALELDNTLADAHAILAGYRCWVEWDWEGAEKAYQQALGLNPNLWLAHEDYSHLLCFMGRPEEALSHMELALELNPLNPLSNYFYGRVLEYNRRYDDAIAAYRTALEIEPPLSYRNRLARNLGFKGKHDEELALYREIWADNDERLTALEDGFEKAGYKGAYRALADLWVEEGRSAKVIGTWYRMAGDYEEAIDWFEKAYEEHHPNLPYITLPSDSDPLRSYPRFQELLRKMNLPVDEKE